MAKMIQCPKCGKPYYSTLKMCPECGMPRPKNKANILLYIFIGLIVCGILTAAIGTLMEDDAPVSEIETGGIPSSSDVQTNDSSSTESKENVINVGGTIQANDVKIEFLKVEDWTSDNMFIKPKDGNKFIRAYFSFTNTGKADRMVGSWDFECYVDNAQIDSMLAAGDDALSTGTISAGRNLKGYLYYEVPKNASSIELEYETNWWTDKKAIFKVK